MPPTKIGLIISDLITGLYAANAIQAALRAREVVGAGGQHIDMSLLDVAVATMSHRAIDYLMSGEVPQPLSNPASIKSPAVRPDIKLSSPCAQKGDSLRAQLNW